VRVTSAAVDQDGDRYGFVRNLKSANDEINQRRSKALHEVMTAPKLGEACEQPFDQMPAGRRAENIADTIDEDE
jgi:hypothetical protein